MPKENDTRLYIPVKLKKEKYQEVVDLAEALASERGSNVTYADAIAEAIKFYRENRPKP